MMPGPYYWPRVPGSGSPSTTTFQLHNALIRELCSSLTCCWCVNEFHLTRSIRGCGPLLPPEIEGQLRDLKEYLPQNEAGFPSTDVWEKDKGNLLRLACWLHCLDMAFTYSRGTAQSLRRKDHEEIGSLLQFL